MGVRGSKIGRTRAEKAHVKNELAKKTPQVNINTQFQKGYKLIKPCENAVEGYNDCKGTIAELWKEAKQFLFMFKNMMKFLNDDDNCPLAKEWCMNLVKTTHTLENMWRAFFKKNEWGENGEKGLQHIVNDGFRNIPAIRNDLLKIHGGNGRTQKMLEKRVEPLIAEHFRCIEIVRLIEIYSYNTDGRLELSGYNFEQERIVVECLDACSCSRQQKTVVVYYEEESRGFAIRVAEKNKKGEFVCEHVGDIKVAKENQTGKKRDKSYDAALKVYDKELAICSANIVNISRFMAHACAIFMEAYNRETESSAIVPRIGVYALKNIEEAGEEVTIRADNETNKEILY